MTLHLAGHTVHSRKGRIANAFRYGVDYVLLNPEEDTGPTLFSHNRTNLAALHDTDHGGAPGQGRGAVWVRETIARHNLPTPTTIRLLAQPRLLGHVFNPVSFWLCEDATGLRVMIAEVTNTYGDRHSYLCHRADLAPIGPDDHLNAQKIFHVSPFQTVAGSYTFRIDLRTDRINIVINYSVAEGGLTATLTGPLTPLTNAGLLKALMRRPFGSRRVLALIHWQALKLWFKGARFRHRPHPPTTEVS
ncbi:MAG: DUF1365 domain-containing protein [Cypionkella sp.]